jgi:hypothetical protein
MKHWHHIVPRHMGGTDDPDNLVQLTIEEHAEVHRVAYEQHGRWEDKVAWLGLAKLIGKEELLKEILANRKSIKGIPKPEGFGAKISKARKGKDTWNKGKVIGPYPAERNKANSEGQKKTRTTCPVCGLTTTISNYKRYGHGEGCKKAS